MSYLSDWKEWEEGSQAAREANPLCDESATCPAPSDGHLVGCRANRTRLSTMEWPSGPDDHDQCGENPCPECDPDDDNGDPTGEFD